MGASIIEGTKAAPTCWGDVLILGLGKSGKAAASYCLNLLGGRVKSVTIAAGEKNDAALEFAARCEAQERPLDPADVRGWADFRLTLGAQAPRQPA